MAEYGGVSPLQIPDAYGALSVTLIGDGVQDGTPAPDAPITPQFVAGDVAVTGRNLLAPGAATNLIAGMTYTFSYDCTASAGECTLHYITDGRDVNLVPIVFNRVGRVSTAFVPSEDAVNAQMSIYQSAQGASSNYKIELGSVATPYEPYTASGTMEDIALNGIRLGATIPAAIQAVPGLMAGVWKGADNIYRIGDTVENRVLVDGAWKKRTTQRLMHVTGAGAGNVLAVGDTVRLVIPLANNSVCTGSSSMTTPDICDHLPMVKAYYLDEVHFYAAADSIFVWVPVSDDYSYLSTYNFWYVLAEPIVTLSDPVPLSAVPGVTNVTCGSAVAPYIEVITDDTAVGHIGATNA